MAAVPALISPADYLRLEAEAKVKHEYVAGSVYAMSGASRNHVEIQAALATELGTALRNSVCRPLGSDTKVWVEEANAYYYPDATVSCPPNFINEASGVVDNPTVIFEVLSPSTRSLDRGPKFQHYRSLPSLRDYVLIESAEAKVTVNSLEGGEWVRREYTEGSAKLSSIGVELSLAELYRHAEFPKTVKLYEDEQS